MRDFNARTTCVTMTAALLGLGLSASPADAAKYRWYKTGLQNDIRAAYSHKDCSGLASDLRDPVNTIWYGSQATVENVAWALSNKVRRNDGSNWHWDDSRVAGGTYDADKNQAVYTRSLGCRLNQATRADASFIASRNHVRIYGIDKPGTSSRRKGFITAGTAHADHVIFFGKGDCALPAQHAATFEDGARALAEAWRGATNRRWRSVFWGNTQAIQQCDRSLASGDGWARYLKVPTAWGKRARAGSVDTTMLSGPTITGTPTPGLTLTAHPGTWSPTPAGFHYQWCILPAGWTPAASSPDPMENCQAVGGDSPTLQLPQSSAGGLATVRVALAGSPSDFEYDKWVAIGSDETPDGPPTAFSPPSLSTCGAFGGECTVDPGVWQGADEILYAPMFCSTDVQEYCGPTSTEPNVGAFSEGGSCFYAYRAVTVIARNSAGETRVPMRTDGEYLCIQ